MGLNAPFRDLSDAHVAKGAHTATSAEATADAAAIVTGLDSITTFQVQILRAGVDVKADAAVTASGGTLTVADGAGTYAVTAGDVIHWVAWGPR